MARRFAGPRAGSPQTKLHSAAKSSNLPNRMPKVMKTEHPSPPTLLGEPPTSLGSARLYSFHTLGFKGSQQFEEQPLQTHTAGVRLRILRWTVGSGIWRIFHSQNDNQIVCGRKFRRHRQRKEREAAVTLVHAVYDNVDADGAVPPFTSLSPLSVTLIESRICIIEHSDHLISSKMSSQDYYNQQQQQPSYPQQSFQQPPQYQQGYGEQPQQGYYPPEQQGMNYQQQPQGQYQDDRGRQDGGGGGAAGGCLAGLCCGLCACCACEAFCELLECCFFCC
ncbi:hypothetical protein TWF970_007170 [Orbilia oligospora]|nr:hypothetical protein TWF970_007170 [Orbilia oligospora]